MVDVHGADPTVAPGDRPGGRVGSLTGMSTPVVVAVAPDSPAGRAGLVSGDLILSINGAVPRDVIEYQLLVD